MFRPYKERRYFTTKEVVTRLFDQAGGIKRAAHILDRSPTQTTAYSDPGTTDEITYDMVRRLIESTGATAPVEDAAALAGGVFVPIMPEPGNFEHLIARSSKEWGEFIGLIVQAHAAGKIAKLERPDILKELDSLIRTLVSARSLIISERWKT